MRKIISAITMAAATLSAVAVFSTVGPVEWCSDKLPSKPILGCTND